MQRIIKSNQYVSGKQWKPQITVKIYWGTKPTITHINIITSMQKHSFSNIRNKWPPELQENQPYSFMIIRTRLLVWIYVLYGILSTTTCMTYICINVNINLDDKNGTCIYLMKLSLNICYLTQLRIPWKSWPIHFQEYQPILFLPLTCGDRVISAELRQYHGCWSPGSLRRQDISNHDIDDVA